MSPEFLLHHPSASLSPPQLFAPLAHAYTGTAFLRRGRNLKSEKLTSSPSTTVPGKMTMRRKSPPIGVTGIGKNSKKRNSNGLISASLDLSEDNVRLVLADAREEFPQIFDTSVGMTGVAELAEVDGPFVRIRLKGRFWHERSLVLARLGNYLKQRIPEILEVDIEDEKQLDDSPANF